MAGGDFFTQGQPVGCGRFDSFQVADGEQRRGPQLAMHRGAWLYLQYRKRVCFSSSPPRASSSPVFFKALAVSCFRRQLQSLPPTSGAGEKDQQQVNMTEVCSLSYTLPPLVHPLLLPPSPPPPPGEKHKLDITAREKVIFILWQALSVQSYFRRMLSSVATHNISSFIQEEQAGNHIYKEVFLPRWVGSDLSDVPLGSIKRRPECNYSHGKTEHERIVRTIGRPFVVNVGHSAAESGKHTRLPARMGTLWWNIILQQHIQIDFGQWV